MDKARYKELRGALRKTTSFPNTRTDAEFKHHSQTIHLQRTTKAQYDRLTRDGNVPALKAHDETIIHELTHWADLVATLWGRTYLADIYSAMHVALRENQNGIEYEYWRLVALRDMDRRTGLPAYYRVIAPSEAPHDSSKPWRIMFSCGQEFDSEGRIDEARPIYFVRFHDSATDEQIARQPLRVSALIETIAVWSEMVTGNARLQKMDSGEAAVERRLWTNALQDRIYSKELTVYTAPAHMLSFHTQSRDLFLTYRNAAALSHLVLNLSPSLFFKLRHDRELETFGRQRLYAFKRGQDRGYAYAVICRNAPLSTPDRSARQWLDEALAASGLPSSEQIYLAARSEMIHPKKKLFDGPFAPTLSYLNDVGLRFFDARTSSDTPEISPAFIDNADLPLPLMFDDDGDLFHVGRSALDERLFEPETMYKNENRIFRVTENFLTSCR